MEPVTVKNRNVPIAPRKLRLVCGLIRGRDVALARKALRFCERRRAALVLDKLMGSALAIADSRGASDVDALVVDRVTVDGGRTVKRVMPRAKGRAFRIKRRTGHVTMTLAERRTADEGKGEG